MRISARIQKQYTRYFTLSEGYLREPYRRLAWEQDPDGFFVWSAGIRKSNLGPKHEAMYRAL